MEKEVKKEVIDGITYRYFRLKRKEKQKKLDDYVPIRKFSERK